MTIVKRHMKHQLWWQVRLLSWNWPLWLNFYPFILKHFNQRLYKNLAKESTQLIIEGFPRSANTFLVHATEQASSLPIQIAHHLHDPIQAKIGLEHKIPTVIILRDPLSSFISFKLKSPHLPVSVMYKIYMSFHHQVNKIHNENIHFVRYEDVTQKPNDVVQWILEELLKHRKDQINMVHEDDIFSSIDKKKKARESANPDLNAYYQSSVARPTEEKEAQKEKIRATILDNFSTECEKATVNYEKLLNRCVSFSNKSNNSTVKPT